MITKIEPEPGGEKLGILRVELSVPFDRNELDALGDWFLARGWTIEYEQIVAYLNGEEWKA